MKIQALIARLTTTTTNSTTFTATMTDSTTIAATTTIVSIGTADEIGQMDSNLVRIAAVDQITLLPTSMSRAPSVTTMSSIRRSSTVRAPYTRTPNTR